MSIRDEVSSILKIRIPNDRWEATFEELSTSGFIDNKVMLNILILLCKHIESIEDANTIKPTK